MYGIMIVVVATSRGKNTTSRLLSTTTGLVVLVAQISTTWLVVDYQ